MERGGYAVINRNYRYIQYHDGSEEFYDLQNDPNEWNNLVSDNSYQNIIDEMKKTAPVEFKESASPRNTLKLIIKGDSYHWESKDDSKPADFVGASLTFTNPINENGITFIKESRQESDAYTEQQIKADKDCRYIPTNKYGYFKVDDALISSNHTNVTFDISYFDDSNNSFELQYTSKKFSNKSIEITKTNTKQWLSRTVMLADAALNNQLNNQADFKISGNVYIRSVDISRPKPSDVSVIFADNIIENGIEFLIGTDPGRETYTEKAEIGNNDCRHIPKTDKNKYGYFKVDDAVIKPGDNKLTFEITYFNEGTNPLKFQYNSVSEKYEKAEIAKTDTRTWLTRSFTITDAAFNNKQNNQSDFRIVGDSYIRRVAIKKGDINTHVKEQIKKVDYNVKVRFSEEKLQITIPLEMINADVSVYNLLGQMILQTKMNQSEKSFHLNTDSKFCIVVLQKGNSFTSRKILIQ